MCLICLIEVATITTMASQWNALIHIKYFVSTYSVLTILVTHNSPMLAKSGGCKYNVTAKNLLTDAGYWKEERITILFHLIVWKEGRLEVKLSFTCSDFCTFLSQPHHLFLLRVQQICWNMLTCSSGYSGGTQNQNDLPSPIKQKSKHSLILFLLPPSGRNKQFHFRKLYCCYYVPRCLYGASQSLHRQSVEIQYRLYSFLLLKWFFYFRVASISQICQIIVITKTTTSTY